MTRAASARPFALAWILYAAALLLGMRFLAAPGLVEHMAFRQLYVAGRLAGADPARLYDVERQREILDDHVDHGADLLQFLGPPFEAWLFRPLARLPYPAAYYLFASLNLALLALCFALCRAALARPGTVAQPRAGLQIFAFLPVTIAVRQGHDSLLLLAGLCAVWRLLSAERRLAAGCVLALLLFKAQLCLPLALLLAARSGLRFLAGFLAGASAVTLLSAAVAGRGGLEGFAGTAWAAVRLTLFEIGPLGTFGRLSLAMPNLKGLVTAATRDFLPGGAVFLLILAFSGAVLVWALRALRRPGVGLERAFALAVVCAVLVSYWLGIEDLTVLLVPFGLLSGVPGALVSRSMLATYFAMPLLMILGPRSLFLLCLPLLVFAYAAAAGGARESGRADGAS